MMAALFLSFLIPNNGSTYNGARDALKDGYRSIDTAAAYFNEEAGRAVRDSRMPRYEYAFPANSGFMTMDMKRREGEWILLSPTWIVAK